MLFERAAAAGCATNGWTGREEPLTTAVAIAHSLSHDSFFGRNLSHFALMDLCVSAVALHVDLGLDWRAASAESLENVTVICVPQVFGIAGAKWERAEFCFDCRAWVDTASNFSVDR